MLWWCEKSPSKILTCSWRILNSLLKKNINFKGQKKKMRKADKIWKYFFGISIKKTAHVTEAAFPKYNSNWFFAKKKNILSWSGVKDEDDRLRYGRRECRKGLDKEWQQQQPSTEKREKRSELTLIKQTKNKLKIKEKNLPAYIFSWWWF